MLVLVPSPRLMDSWSCDMRLDVITILPEYLDPLRHALLGKAIEKHIIPLGVHNLRDWATDVHKSVDDTPYG